MFVKLYEYRATLYIRWWSLVNIYIITGKFKGTWNTSKICRILLETQSLRKVKNNFYIDHRYLEKSSCYLIHQNGILLSLITNHLYTMTKSFSYEMCWFKKKLIANFFIIFIPDSKNTHIFIINIHKGLFWMYVHAKNKQFEHYNPFQW